MTNLCNKYVGKKDGNKLLDDVYINTIESVLSEFYDNDKIKISEIKKGVNFHYKTIYYRIYFNDRTK